MATLHIYIREHLGAPAGDEAIAYPWALRDAQGVVRQAGESRLRDMPVADRCEVVAPAGRVLLTQIALPAGNRQKLRRMLPYAVEDKVMTEPEKIHVVAGPRLADGQTALAVIDKEWLAAALAQLQDARLRPYAMWVETLLPAASAESWTVVWKESEGFVRCGLAAGVFLDSGPDGESPIGLQLAVQEARANQAAPLQIIVRAQRGASMPDLQLWADRLQIDVRAGERWDWFERLANDGVNLLQDDFAPGSRTREWLPRLRPALVLLGLIVAVQVIGVGVDWLALNHQKSELQATIEQRFRSAFPEAKVVVDAPLQMRRNLEELRRVVGQIEDGDFLPLLARTTRLIEASASHRLSGLNYDAGQLKVDILLPDEQAAENLKNALQTPDLTVRLESVNAKSDGEGGGGVTARFSLSSGARS